HGAHPELLVDGGDGSAWHARSFRVAGERVPGVGAPDHATLPFRTTTEPTPKPAGAPPEGAGRGADAMRDLADRLHALWDPLPFPTSWYLKDLATDEVADRAGSVAVPSASTQKISIMMAALQAVHEGKLALDQKVTIEARYQDNDSGTFQHLTPGF